MTDLERGAVLELVKRACNFGERVYDRGMDPLYTGCRIQNHIDRSRAVRIAKLLVDI